jgi:enoyl-CoA hydratase/carnithine racemase
MKYVIATYNQHVAHIKLNRPDNRNAFNDEMIQELCLTVKAWNANPEVRCIIVSGTGDSFCAGGDIKLMQEKKEMFRGEPHELSRNYNFGIQEIARTFESLSVPVIAMVNGAAIGAGCDLACMCDIRIGSNNSLFSESFAKLNLVPGDGGTFFLQRVVGFSKAMQMTLTAQSIKGKDAYHFGLLNCYIDNDQELLNKTVELAEGIASLAPTALRMAKRSLINAYRNDLASTLDLLNAYQGIAQNMQDHFRALESATKKSPTQFEGN